MCILEYELPGGESPRAIWDLKNDVQNQWVEFSTQLLAARNNGREVSFNLGNLKERLPFTAWRAAGLEVQGISLVSKSGTLVTGLSVSIVQADMPWDVGKVRNCTMRSCRGLQEKNLGGWVINALGSAVSEKETEV